MEYKVIRSSRKTVSLQVRSDGSVIVRAPYRYPDSSIEKLILEKQNWIETHIKKQKEDFKTKSQLSKYSDEEIQQMHREAHVKIIPRLEYFSSAMGVHYSDVHFRCQKSRWGSCSSKGNLNFNILLSQMPAEVIDYVVVHELSHRIEMNHSPQFWAIVEKVLPNYKERRKWLKTNGKYLLAKVEDK